MSGNDGRPICAMLLSCISAGPRYFLPLSDDFHKKFKLVVYGDNTANAVPGQMAACEAEIHAADVFIYHNADWMPFMGDDHEPYEELLARVPNRVKKIAFPLPHLHAFWPHHGPDPRNSDTGRPRNRHGEQPCYPYGDSYVLELIKQGLPPEEVISRYLALDVATVVDLDKIMSWTIAQAERNDRTTEVKVADIIGSSVRSPRLFQSINHANNRLLLNMSNQVLKLLDCAPISESVLDRTLELVEPQSPVHPSIGRHFGAHWASAQTRYSLGARRSLTYAEYLRDYVYFA
jgi:Polysaccharide biosynthesis enzyme WcbI